MGFSKGSVAEATSESNGFPLYTGIAPVNVVAVNPTAEQLSAIYGRKIEKVTEYTGRNKGDIQYIRLDFILKVAEAFLKEKGIEEEVFGKLTLFLMAGAKKNADETKLKVINDFGQTSWVTADVLQKMGYPLTNDGQEMRNFLLPYKPCVEGEEELIKFLRAYINIPNHMEMVDGIMKPVSADRLDDCKSSFTLDEIKGMINGNITPVKNAVELQPHNQVKVLFAVRVTPENKKYAHVYNRFFAKAKDYGAKERFEKFVAANNQSIENLEFNYDFGKWEETPSSIPNNSSNNNNDPW